MKPITRDIYNELLSGLDELDDAYGRTAESTNARLWLKELAQHCLDMEPVPVTGGTPVDVSSKIV